MPSTNFNCIESKSHANNCNNNYDGNKIDDEKQGLNNLESLE